MADRGNTPLSAACIALLQALYMILLRSQRLIDSPRWRLRESEAGIGRGRVDGRGDAVLLLGMDGYPGGGTHAQWTWKDFGHVSQQMSSPSFRHTLHLERAQHCGARG